MARTRARARSRGDTIPRQLARLPRRLHDREECAVVAADGVNPSVLRAEQRRAVNPDPVQPVQTDRPQRPQAVAHAPPEIDTTRLLEVAYRHRHVAQAEPEPHRLYQELSVEDEVVGVLLEGNALQHRAAIDAEAAVEIAKVLTQGEVLDRRQEAVGKVLPRRHPALERLVAR